MTVTLIYILVAIIVVYTIAIPLNGYLMSRDLKKRGIQSFNNFKVEITIGAPIFACFLIIELIVNLIIDKCSFNALSGFINYMNRKFFKDE